MTTTIRVILPTHLRNLAGVAREVAVDVPAGAAVTQRAVLDALEAKYPTLRGAIRDHGSQKRRPLVRFFACEEDLSHESPDAPLPEKVAAGEEPFFIIGAIAGGSPARARARARATATAPAPAPASAPGGAEGARQA